MRGFLIFLGLLLVLAGGAVAAAQYAPVDLAMLDSVAGAKDFLLSPMALYAGGGGAAFGLLLIIIALATGGKKKPKPAKASKAEPVKAAPAPEPKKPKPAPKPVAPQPVAATPAPPRPPTPTAQPSPKPTASAQPPGPTPSAAPPPDVRLLNRKRVQDIVTINDALKAYHAKHGAFPKANGLDGILTRGAMWIPGLAPDFLKTLPQDPAMASDPAGPQYVYVSDGTDYKLLAQNVSLVGGNTVEVLGVKIDTTRNPTPQNASFGFWTPKFESA